ncbi:unnamed protein product [Dibothriocephalus latus]|uniref:Bromo domain-containing protein n=1 Tax=Dibothriocephalus latus TaxID=60516 RepID=A0A3P6QS81_DIBLA|nr:unnamed protein product [Dibothriocephalus latus]
MQANNKKKRKLAQQVAISDKRQCIRPDFKTHLAPNQSSRKDVGTRGRRPKRASSFPPNSSDGRIRGMAKPRQGEQQQSHQTNVCRFSDLLPKHQKQQKQRQRQRKMLFLKRQRHQAVKSLVCFKAKRSLKRGKLPPVAISTNNDGVGCNHASHSPADFDKESGSANGFSSRTGSYLGRQNESSPNGLFPHSDLGSANGSSSLEAPSQGDTRGTSRPKRSRTTAGKLRQPMNTIDLEFCRRATEDLIAHEASWPFRRPVSSKGVPLYRKVIKRPIDLSTILKRLSDEKV